METVEEELSKRLKAQIDESPKVRAILKEVSGKGLEPYSAAIEFLDSGVDLDSRWSVTPPPAADSY